MRESVGAWTLFLLIRRRINKKKNVLLSVVFGYRPGPWFKISQAGLGQEEIFFEVSRVGSGQRRVGVTLTRPDPTRPMNPTLEVIWPDPWTAALLFLSPLRSLYHNRIKRATIGAHITLTGPTYNHGCVAETAMCCLHIKPLFLPNISTGADSSSVPVLILHQYPTSVPVLILHPRESQYDVVTGCEAEKKWTKKKEQPELIKVRQVKC